MVSDGPQKLERGIFGDPNRMTTGPEKPIIEWENDIDAPSNEGGGGGIPQHLQEAIQYQSVDAPVQVQVQDETRPTLKFDSVKINDENPQSRFRVLDIALLAPGVCALCGSSGFNGDRQFVDFGKTVDMFGCVYFCTFCVVEAATMLGMDFKSNWVLAEKNLQAEISDVDDRFVESQVLLRAAMDLVRNCTCANSGIGLPVVEVSESDIIVDETSDVVKSDFDELGGLEGFDDLPANSNNTEPVPDAKPKRVRKPAG